MSQITDISRLVPHAGDMMLIDAVESWDDGHIVCRAAVANPARHPLARDGVLPAAALAEYGAQAMAVHGGLLAARRETPRQGLLAGLNDLELRCEQIDRPVRMTIKAWCEMHGATGSVYRFEVSADSGVLATGQATVVFVETEPA